MADKRPIRIRTENGQFSAFSSADAGKVLWLNRAQRNGRRDRSNGFQYFQHSRRSLRRRG